MRSIPTGGANNLVTHEWLTSFLARRELEKPDGRPLYAYELDAAEFVELEELLRTTKPASFGSGVARCLVMYGAGWFSRIYEGGAPEWDGVLTAIGWSDWLYHQHYNELRAAFSWWGVELFRTNQGRQYVGSMLRQAGLPRKLQRGVLRRFLVASLADFPPMRWGHASGQGFLASRRSHLPLYLQNEDLFALCGQLLDVIWESHRLSIEPPPDAMPISMSEAEAQALVEVLRRAAPEPEDPELYVEPVRFVRRLVDRGAGDFQLRGEYQFPRRLSSDALESWAGVELPMRIDLRSPSHGGRLIASARRDGATFTVTPARASARVVLGRSATEQTTAQARVPDAQSRDAKDGEALSELPWVFALPESGGALIAEGGCGLEAQQVLVALPEAVTEFDGDAREVGHIPDLGRRVFQISERVDFLIEDVRCVIDLSSTGFQRRTATLRGREVYLRGASVRLFSTPPRVAIAVEGGGSSRTVPLEWFDPTESRWSSRPPGHGEFRVRAVESGELMFAGRIALVPDHFDIVAEFRGRGRGALRVDAGLDARVGAWMRGHDGGVEPQLIRDGSSVFVEVDADDAAPGVIEVSVSWPNSTPLMFRLPSPIERVVFEGPSGPLQDQQEIGVDELYGLAAVAYSGSMDGNFSILATLKAMDLSSDVLQSVTFSEGLRSLGHGHWRLDLDEVYDRIAELLSYSNDVDAWVRLEFHHYATIQRWLAISRFSRGISLEAISPDTDSSEVRISTSLATRVAGLSLRHPEYGLQKVLEPGMTAVLPAAGDRLNVDIAGAPWLLVGERASAQAVRPALWAPKTEGEVDDANELVSAIVSNLPADERVARIEHCLAALVADWNPVVGEYLLALLEASRAAHPAALDVFTALQAFPEAVPHVLARSGSKDLVRYLLSFNEDFPFSFHLVPQRAWHRSLKRSGERLADRVEAMVSDVEEKRVLIRALGADLQSLYEEIASRHPAINFHRDCLPVELRPDAHPSVEKLPPLGFSPDSNSLKATISRIDDAYRKMLPRWTQVPWPHSHIDIDRWCLALREYSSTAEQHLRLLYRGVFGDSPMERGPLVAAPLAAAYASAIGLRTTVALQIAAKRMYALDSEWFEDAYLEGLVFAYQMKDMEL